MIIFSVAAEFEYFCKVFVLCGSYLQLLRRLCGVFAPFVLHKVIESNGHVTDNVHFTVECLLVGASNADSYMKC